MDAANLNRIQTATLRALDGVLTMAAENSIVAALKSACDNPDSVNDVMAAVEKLIGVPRPVAPSQPLRCVRWSSMYTGIKDGRHDVSAYLEAYDGEPARTLFRIFPVNGEDLWRIARAGDATEPRKMAYTVAVAAVVERLQRMGYVYDQPISRHAVGIAFVADSEDPKTPGDFFKLFASGKIEDGPALAAAVLGFLQTILPLPTAQFNKWNDDLAKEFPVIYAIAKSMLQEMRKPPRL